MLSLGGSKRALRRCLVSAGILLMGSWASHASADTFQLLSNLHGTGGGESVVNLAGTVNQGGVISDILQWEDLSGTSSNPSEERHFQRALFRQAYNFKRTALT